MRGTRKVALELDPCQLLPCAKLDSTSETNDNPSYFVQSTSTTIPDDCGDAVAVLKSADSGGDDALAVGSKVTLGSYLACLNLASYHPSTNSKQRRVVGADIDITVTMENAKATAYLEALLNKKLRVFTSDSRMFLGDFKCTDNECNVILAQSFEYRHSTSSALEAVAKATSTSATSVKIDMTSRFLGLIVVPGQHITKIEVEDP